MSAPAVVAVARVFTVLSVLSRLALPGLVAIAAHATAIDAGCDRPSCTASYFDDMAGQYQTARDDGSLPSE